jgi:hypothetical protein
MHSAMTGKSPPKIGDQAALGKTSVDQSLPRACLGEFNECLDVVH